MPPTTYIETGDLDDLKARGKLRILVPRPAALQHLPRRGFPLDHEIALATELAESLELEAVVVPVARHDYVVPKLLSGEGDIAVATLTQTASRQSTVAFSLPLARVTERLVQRAAEPPITEVEQLAGRTIVVRRSSSYWETAETLQRQVDVGLKEADEVLDTEQIIHEVASGRFDLTLGDSDLVSAALQYRDDVVSELAVSEPRPVGWALRPDARALREAANDFLASNDVAAARADRFSGDLPELKRRKVLRLITRNSAATYFLHRGELMGFEYELWKRFAEEQGLRLQVVVPPSRDELIPWLLEGRGDVVGAGLTVTPARLANLDIAFTVAYHEAAEVVVKRPGETVRSLDDLAGRKVAVRPSSSYHDTLSKLRADGLRVELVDVPEDTETELVLQGVAEGLYDLAVADSHIVAIEQAHQLPLETAFQIRGPLPHGAVVRAGDRELKAALDDFVRRTRDDAFMRLLHRRYFSDPRRITSNTRVRSDRGGALSPFDALVKEHAEDRGFDWRLIVAQMYQESHFEPDATSWAGARGLLQLMPRTAGELGVTDPTDPEQAIRGGVTYLGLMRDRFGNDLTVADRNWFALASYNAGYGHVVDAQRLARRQGWDPGRWFGNVERAMLLLMEPKHARRARHGYVRGTEPVHYVRTIRDRYRAYRLSEP
ncbi:MAG: transporter substrate-binding domain-containing protein [Myxococcota bacterium]